MSYKSKFGGTDIIKSKFNNLQISYDANDSKDLFKPDRKKIYPVLLFTPNTDNFQHFHIELNKGQAKKLRDWLDAYLKDTK